MYFDVEIGLQILLVALALVAADAAESEDTNAPAVIDQMTEEQRYGGFRGGFRGFRGRRSADDLITDEQRYGGYRGGFGGFRGRRSADDLATVEQR